MFNSITPIRSLQKWNWIFVFWLNLFVNQNWWYLSVCWFWFQLVKKKLLTKKCVVFESTSFTDNVSIKTVGRYETIGRSARIDKSNTCTTHYTNSDRAQRFIISSIGTKRKQLFNQASGECGRVHASVLVCNINHWRSMNAASVWASLLRDCMCSHVTVILFTFEQWVDVFQLNIHDITSTMNFHIVQIVFWGLFWHSVALCSIYERAISLRCVYSTFSYI